MRTGSLIVWVFAVQWLACSAGPPVEDVQRLSQPLTQCAPAWVEGVDAFDGQGTIDWPRARAAGVAFAFMKATQGTYDTQSTFASNWAGTKAAGVLRGAYHFFDPTEDGAAQAAHFLAVVGSPQAGDLPPMIDLECPDGAADCVYPGRSGAGDPVAIRARVDAFLAAVGDAWGAKPVVYTFPAYFAGSGVDPAGLDAYPLFLASVGPSGAPATGSCLGVPAPWSGATFWQYAWTGTIDGIEGDVDKDRFLGDPAALARLLGAPPGCR